ncbi:hypothetical protein QQ045_025046 [Rhodiola kirilowii]
MFPLLMQPHDGGVFPLGHGRDDIHGIGGSSHGIGDPCLVLTSDPKPRLRWTADLHDRFVDAVTQLGGPNKATPKAIMRTMGVKGLTLFHLKSHLQKYRLGKQSGKEMCDIVKDGSYLLEGPESNNSAGKMLTPDTNEGFEVKEALRAQMEVQSKLHLQVEAEKHLQIRQDAERRYMAMLETACKMLADHYIGGAVIDADNDKTNKTPPSAFSFNTIPAYTSQPSTLSGLHGLEELIPSLYTQRADCSTESCLTSHDSPAAYTLQGLPSRSMKRMFNADSVSQFLLSGEANMRMPNVSVSQGIIGFST